MNEKKGEKKVVKTDQIKSLFYYFNFKNTKNPIKNLIARTITHMTKGKAKERPKRLKACKNQRRERVSPSCGKELSHPQPF
jgi:transcription initiation factor IIE alpha subunit